MGKRGRPKKKNVVRENNGRISRTVQNENEEPIKTRMRMLGLSEKDARDQKAQSVHGVMYLKRQITEQQYDAGEAMFRLRQSYLKAIKAPNALVAGQGGGFDLGLSDDYINWANSVTARYKSAEREMQDAQAIHRGSNLFAALDYMLFRNEHHRHMEGDFSIVLRVLAVHFGLTKKSKSDSMSEILRSVQCA